MGGARNDPQTIQMIKPGLIAAMHYLADQVYNINQECVQAAVYSKGGGGKYGRTMDLLKAWKAEAYGNGNGATGKFSYDPSKMDFHPSWVNGGGVQAGLIEIVYHGLAGDFGWGYHYAHQDPIFAGKPWAGARDAWALLRSRVGKHKIYTLFGEGLSAAGINYVPKSAAIGEYIYDEP